MAKKVWYKLVLVSQSDNYKEELVKVKSKGLAYNVKNTLETIYKDTNYKIELL